MIRLSAMALATVLTFVACAGTAAPSGQITGLGNGSAPALGTGNPEVDKEDRQVGGKIKNICRGC